MQAVVVAKFPALLELAKQRVALMRNPDTLQQLVIFIINAPDEATARWLLTTSQHELS